jgi:hypothetical protein
LQGGPASKDGWLIATLYVRDRGIVTHAVSIQATAAGDELTIRVTPARDILPATEPRMDGGFTITTHR